MWEAMTLAFFGCLRAAELTIPSKTAFNPSIHLCLSDVKLNTEGKHEFGKIVYMAIVYIF